MTPQHDEDEVWRQIIASYNESAEESSAAPPWPDRENVAQQGEVTITDAPLQAQPDEDENENEDEPVAAEDVDHFVPPPPPPPPQVDPVSKAAWVALFGGPAYLLIATIGGLPMDPWIVFTAVAAFIAGFVVLVVRMGDGPPNDSWDDGAVL